MSNALAGFLEAEWLKFKAWFHKEHASLDERITALEQRAKVIESKLINPVEVKIP